MFIEPTITWVEFSGYIWLDTKIVFKKKYKLQSHRENVISSHSRVVKQPFHVSVHDNS